MDTKAGYIYGALEESELRSGSTIALGSGDAIESSRKQAERAAFEKLMASSSIRSGGGCTRGTGIEVFLPGRIASDTVNTP